jgi:hypothetical protein
MYKILLDICHKYGYINSPNKSGITLELIIQAELTGNINSGIMMLANCSRDAATRSLKNAFVDRNPIKNKSLTKFLLGKDNKAACSSCGLVNTQDYFYSNGARGISSVCKECNKTMRKTAYRNNPDKEITKNSIRRKVRSSYQTPPWANLEIIKKIYSNAEGMHVDHIIPLNGLLVSGLHVETNLQYLTPEENLRKGNSFLI